MLSRAVWLTISRLHAIFAFHVSLPSAGVASSLRRKGRPFSSGRSTERELQGKGVRARSEQTGTKDARDREKPSRSRVFPRNSVSQFLFFTRSFWQLHNFRDDFLVDQDTKTFRIVSFLHCFCIFFSVLEHLVYRHALRPAALRKPTFNRFNFGFFSWNESPSSSFRTRVKNRFSESQ